jgi:protein-disulfide isomerase/uncharacterized membrane protein
MFFFAVLGLVASVYLTAEHIKGNPISSSQPASQPATEPAAGGAGLFDDICTAFATWSCELVSESKWGRIPFGQPEGKPSIPTAELGLIYFIFVICWLLFVGTATPDRWWVHFLFTLVNAAGVGASVFLEYVMWTQLEYRCPFCMVSHGANLLIFVGALLLWPRTPREVIGVVAEAGASPSRPSFRAVATALAVFVLATGGQHFFWLTGACRGQMKRAEGGALQQEVKAWKWYADYWRKEFKRYDDRWQIVYMSWLYEPVLPIVTEGEPVRGPADARHTIVLFSDVQCPACGKLEEMLLREIIPAAARHGGVKVIFKHYPICLSCNPYAGRDLHPEACLAAQAVEAARIVGGDEAFWRMHDWLISRRQRMKGADKAWFVQRAREIGLDPGRFAAAMESEEAAARIRQHIEEANHLGKGVVPADKLDDYKVNSTPTVIVDGRLLRNAGHIQAWMKILETPPAQASPKTDEPSPGS